MTSKTKDAIKSALFEAAFVVLGVILAMAEAMEYHHGLMERLFADHDDGWTPAARQFSRGFVAPARTSRTAWETASETGVFPKTDFAIVRELSHVYAQQDRYEVQTRSVGEIIYAELFRGGTAAIAANYKNLASIIGTFAYREKQMLELYDETIAAMESRDLAGHTE